MNKTILLTATSNCGVGLWTSICVMFASIFGVKSVNYQRKMNKITTEIKRSLEKQMEKNPNYTYGDFRIVKEGNLAYTGTVLGVLNESSKAEN